MDIAGSVNGMYGMKTCLLCCLRSLMPLAIRFPIVGSDLCDSHQTPASYCLLAFPGTHIHHSPHYDCCMYENSSRGALDLLACSKNALGVMQ